MTHNEDKYIEELLAYCKATHDEHYATGEEDRLQTTDILHKLGIAVPFCRGNAIKYLTRYGLKKGRNRKDLFKVLHYVLLMMHFEDIKGKESNDTGHEEV